jgi:hypothetical protein
VSSFLHYKLFHDGAPHCRPKATWPGNHGLKPSKLWVKINFFPYKMIISGTLSQQQEADQHRRTGISTS